MTLVMPGQQLQLDHQVTVAPTADSGRTIPSQDQIVSGLGGVFGDASGAGMWARVPAYSYYLLGLPAPIVLYDVTATLQPDISATTPHQYTYYDQVPKGVVSLIIPTTMTPLPAQFRLCVLLDSLNVAVPEQAAQIVSASFATGLVARLILNEFASKGSGPASLDAWSLTRQPTLTPPSALVSSYGNSKDTFAQRLSVVSQQGTLQASGIFLGWKLGGELGELDGGDTKYRQAVWNLVRMRFTSRDIGELTSYCLGYILGYERTTATMAAASAPRPNPSSTTPNDIFAKVLQDKQVEEFQGAISDFFSHLLQAVQTAAQGSSGSASYFEFLKGYQSGSLKSSEDLFGATLRLGYGIGYSDGFRVGYERGYAEGYRAGYQAGYDDASDFWGALEDVISFADDAVEILGPLLA